MNAREKISRAIIQMMNHLPFYSELMMRAQILPFPERIKQQPNYSPSMAVCVNGNIYFDEEFVNKLSEEELNFVIMHESAHKAYLHLTRIGKDRDAMIWNVAADISVDYNVKYDMMNHHQNAKVLEGRIIADHDGTITLPALGITVDDVHEKTVEQIYAEIAPAMQKKMQKQKQKQGEGDGEGDGKGKQLGTQIDMHEYADENGKKWEDMTEFEQEELSENAKDELIEAATRCKKRGTLPKGIERMLDKLLRAKINWRQYIWKHVVNEIPFDQTLTRPNRRFISQGLYIPGVVKENVDIVAMIDLSGSVGGKEMADFIHLMTTITNQFRNVNITILSHDSEVQAVTELRMANPKSIKNATYKGGGGTDHRPCFDWVKENKRNCPLVIAFTDGYTRFPEKSDVTCPVIWVISKDGIEREEIPFGVSIKIEDV